MKCINCGGPTIPGFTELYCERECDLRPDDSRKSAKIEQLDQLIACPRKPLLYTAPVSSASMTVHYTLRGNAYSVGLGELEVTRVGLAGRYCPLGQYTQFVVIPDPSDRAAQNIEGVDVATGKLVMSRLLLPSLKIPAGSGTVVVDNVDLRFYA